MKELFGICCLTIILAVAAFEDIMHLKVENRLIVLGWCIGLLLRIRVSGIYGVVYWIFGASVPLILLFILFYFKMIGAADIKIISVIGGFYGAVYSIKVFIMALFIGGILSVIRCIRFGYLKNRMKYFAEYIRNIIKTGTIGAYYIRERDGKDAAIPFTAAIGLSFFTVYCGWFI